MKILGTTLPYALLTVALLAPAQSAAQRAPSGGGLYGSALLPAGSLGGGSLMGGGADLVFGMSPRVSLTLSGGIYGSAVTEEGTLAREYQRYTPAIGVRGSIFGEKTDFALLADLGADIYRLEALNDTPSQTRSIPTASLGAEVRFPIAGPLHLSVSGRDRLSYVRPEELLSSAPTGDREIAHSLELRVGLSMLFRPRESLQEALDRQSPRFTEGMRPIEASTVVFEPTATTQGRDHVHVGEGESRRVEVIDPAVMGGTRAPGSSVLVDAGPVQPVSEQVLGSIYFEQGSFDIKSEYQRLLRDISLYLEQNPAAILEMQGYTDQVGGGVGNLSLGERRGTAVQEQLVRLYNIAPERIRVVSKGIDHRAMRAELARRVDLVAQVPAR